jgi:hypothetical protein
MGHSEMRLAVAGLGDGDVAERIARLADGDWSEFPAADRIAYGFARKLTAEPWAAGAEDLDALTRTFGRHRAVDIVWQVAWGNYMTRVADALQLPLEERAVYEAQFKKPAAPK